MDKRLNNVNFFFETKKIYIFMRLKLIRKLLPFSSRFTYSIIYYYYDEYIKKYYAFDFNLYIEKGCNNTIRFWITLYYEGVLVARFQLLPSPSESEFIRNHYEDDLYVLRPSWFLKFLDKTFQLYKGKKVFRTFLESKCINV